MAREFMPKSSALMPYIVVNRDAAVAGVFTVDGQAGSVDLTTKYVQITNYEQRVGSLEARVTTNTGDITDLKTAVTSINGSIGTINTSLANKAAKGVNSDITNLTALNSSLSLGADGSIPLHAVTLRQMQTAIAAVSSSGGINGVMSTYIGDVSWWNGNSALLPTGYVALNGQVSNRSDFPEIWSLISAGALSSTSDSFWLSSPGSRSSFSTGNGTTTFRWPDLNGVQTQSVGGLFLRGGGFPSDAGSYAGIGQNAAPDFTGWFQTFQGITGATSGAVTKATNGTSNTQRIVPTSGASTNDIITITASNGNSAYGRNGATEVRPNSANGMWIMRAKGTFSSQTMFNVYNTAADAPANGVTVYGGDVTSKYQVNGTDWATGRMRVKGVGGTTPVKTLTLGLDDSSTTKEWSLPQEIGEVAVVVDSGQTTSGGQTKGFVKWSDGTLECWGRVDSNFNTTTAWGSIFNNSTAIPNQAFAVPFVGSLPVVVPGAEYAGSGSLCWGVTSTLTLTGVNMSLLSAVSQGSGKPTYHAKGRWK